MNRISTSHRLVHLRRIGLRRIAGGLDRVAELLVERRGPGRQIGAGRPVPLERRDRLVADLDAGDGARRRRRCSGSSPSLRARKPLARSQDVVNFDVPTGLNWNEQSLGSAITIDRRAVLRAARAPDSRSA